MKVHKVRARPHNTRSRRPPRLVIGSQEAYGALYPLRCGVTNDSGCSDDDPQKLCANGREHLQETAVGEYLLDHLVGAEYGSGARLARASACRIRRSTSSG